MLRQFRGEWGAVASVGVGRWGGGVSLQVKRAGCQGGASCEEEGPVVSGGELGRIRFGLSLTSCSFTLPAFLSSREKYSHFFLLLMKVTKSFIVSELTAVRGYWGKKLQIFTSQYSGHLSEGLVQWGLITFVVSSVTMCTQSVPLWLPMVVYAYNLSTREMRQENRLSKANLGYLARHCPKTTTV